ncbi:hypothetical protein [Kaistia terrae]|uniref:Uncharacterized protein n=1 Tax=Kaistia terrae TaxID=537017 RepID=A0ABW0Q2D2_9HYPH|nr:hypothetical protein [Kaistia terrae]MCX5581503.1 hypothetical protein [Kaistia terrae]
MRMLIAAAAMTLAGFLPALADEPACGQAKETALSQAHEVAQQIKGEVVTIDDATTAQKTADMMFDALGKPSQPVASLIVLKAPGGVALVALFNPAGCFIVGIRVPLAMLIEMIGRSA